MKAAAVEAQKCSESSSLIGVAGGAVASAAQLSIEDDPSSAGTQGS